MSPTRQNEKRRKGVASAAVQPRIYCAGPVFNRAEQAVMAEIAATLEAAGLRAFLPRRDGLLLVDARRDLLRSGYDAAEAERMARSAIFQLNVFQVIERCDGLVANLDGRAPDEGAVAEAAMAWMAGKAVVLYKSDSRSLTLGGDHPVVSGLGQFVTVSTIPEVAYAFAQLFRRRKPERPGAVASAAVRDAAGGGKRLAALLAKATSREDTVAAIISATRSK